MCDTLKLNNRCEVNLQENIRNKHSKILPQRKSCLLCKYCGKQTIRIAYLRSRTQSIEHIKKYKTGESHGCISRCYYVVS